MIVSGGVGSAVGTLAARYAAVGGSEAEGKVNKNIHTLNNLLLYWRQNFVSQYHIS